MGAHAPSRVTSGSFTNLIVTSSRQTRQFKTRDFWWHIQIKNVICYYEKIKIHRGSNRLCSPRQERGLKTSVGRWVYHRQHFLPGTAAADRKKYGGLGVTELRKLRQLEEENVQLKKLVADLSLDKQMLQDVIKKKL